MQKMMKTRREINDEYKKMKFRIGVFQIRNLANGKILVDSSKDLDAIWNRYRFQLDAGMYRNRALQEDWKKYGEEQFVYEVLAELKQDEEHPEDPTLELKELLEAFVEDLQPFGEKGYNR